MSDTTHIQPRFALGAWVMDRLPGLYMALFFVYMFMPLAFMMIAAFNTTAVPPTALPFEGFTLKWFGALFSNAPLLAAVANSLIIGLGVVVLSLTLGLSGALLITRLHARAKSVLYAFLVSPLLTPGIILGISTLVFWNSAGMPGGLFVAGLAQSTFIASYCMLMFIARLQRFDNALEEAALDLGASHQQVFRHITMPFLKPTIITAGLIAFLQSFENFNTTVFAIGTETTLTIKLAALARRTPTPEVNALAVIFIALTVVMAILWEVKRRADAAREKAIAERASDADKDMVSLQIGSVVAAGEAK
ncbi:ABC transporter permease [Lutimaribacter marinistellae]|uniref:ABC transporter permease n=1 Tax=Lutimaribacter marinistellae TaxID=1820329 RepID=A0ABV7TFH0_9RHOB